MQIVFSLLLLGFLFFLKTGSHYITLAGLASASQALELKVCNTRPPGLQPNFEIRVKIE